MFTKGKPPCAFGAKCYRKNPKHFENYSHQDESQIKKRNETDKKDTRVRKKTMKQTTLDFTKKYQSYSELPRSSDGDLNKKNAKVGTPTRSLVRKKFDDNEVFVDKLNKKLKAGVEESSGDSYDCDTLQSTSSEFIKNPVVEVKNMSKLTSLNNKTPEEIIRVLFLVNMPPDFYSFFEFCKTVDKNEPINALELWNMKLVGPFEVLSGKMKYSVDEEFSLCHWRFYYDPPEFQTVLVSESGYHIGYWRDDPKESPVFLASNSDKDCVFKIEAENIFGAVFHYLSDFMKSSDPFKKMKITTFQNAVSEWAEKNNFSLERKTNRICERQKKVVSKTFHKAGIVVPVEAKTKLGYRPLIESEATLKRICNLIMKSDESERESLWENLQPLIYAANIANDECDFGNSLELGIDLFCMGSPLFHNIIEHLLSTAYSLLNRSEFETIIKAHLKNRRKGKDLCAPICS